MASSIVSVVCVSAVWLCASGSGVVCEKSALKHAIKSALKSGFGVLFIKLIKLTKLSKTKFCKINPFYLRYRKHRIYIIRIWILDPGFCKTQNTDAKRAI